MQTILVVGCLLVVVASAANFDSPYLNVWNAWKSKHEKFYETEVEEATRLKVFEKNAIEVMVHNLEYSMGLHTFTLELNKFADMSSEEFAASRLMKPMTFSSEFSPSPEQLFEADSEAQLPPSVDWVSQGYVTNVKDQGNCGSCWAFGATGSLEGAWFKATGNLISLSEQQQVSCNRMCSGCEGGWYTTAFQWWIVNGAAAEADYPYISGKTGRNETCQNGHKIVATINGFKQPAPGSEQALQAATAFNGPILVNIDSNSTSFQFYKSGVYYNSECSNTILDHSVLVVGYGTTASGNKYWKVKNSWSAQWGDDGYIYMSRDRGNNCGIATSTGFPLADIHSNQL
jgi:C1A family cysteine protease